MRAESLALFRKKLGSATYFSRTMFNHWRLILALGGALVAGACSDDAPSGGRTDGSVRTDLGALEDLGAADTGTTDLGPKDGGADAGGPDLGAEDGGQLDFGAPDLGGADLGERDSGPPDLGGSDLGPEDLGPPDTGAPDLGPSDLGTPDMGPPDTGPPDLGPADLGVDGGIRDAGGAAGVIDVMIFVQNNCDVVTTPASIAVPMGTGFTVNWIHAPGSNSNADIAKIDQFNAVPIVIGMEPGMSYHDTVRTWCGNLFSGTFSFRITGCFDPYYLDVDCSQ